MKKKSIPLYELRIDPATDAFVDAVALVEQPAIESDFLAFSKDGERQLFAVNDEKMELLGAAMIPNLQIYRNGVDGGYNVFFSPDTVRQIAQVFMKRGLQSNMNLDHTATPAHSYIYQSYLVDKSKGIEGPKGLNLPDGSWVIGVKVEDAGVWADIKAGKRKGFSVEGLFQFLEPKQGHEKDLDEELSEAMQTLNKVLENKLKNK